MNLQPNKQNEICYSICNSIIKEFKTACEIHRIETDVEIEIDLRDVIRPVIKNFLSEVENNDKFKRK